MSGDTRDLSEKTHRGAEDECLWETYEGNMFSHVKLVKQNEKLAYLLESWSARFSRLTNTGVDFGPCTHSERQSAILYRH